MHNIRWDSYTVRGTNFVTLVGEVPRNASLMMLELKHGSALYRETRPLTQGLRMFSRYKFKREVIYANPPSN